MTGRGTPAPCIARRRQAVDATPPRPRRRSGAALFGACSILRTTSMPSATWPNTTCLPSSQGATRAPPGLQHGGDEELRSVVLGVLGVWSLPHRPFRAPETRRCAAMKRPRFSAAASRMRSSPRPLSRVRHQWLRHQLRNPGGQQRALREEVARTLQTRLNRITILHTNDFFS